MEREPRAASEVAGPTAGPTAGPAAVVAAPGVSGREALARLRRFGGDSLVRDMAAIFLADMPGRIARARAGADGGDAAAVGYAAHTMKSSAAQFGAVALGALCGEAERAARVGDLAALPPLVGRIAHEFDEFRGWLERELRAGPGGQ